MAWKRTSKYGAKPTNGFASKKEANRAAELDMLKKAGKIYALELQKPIQLIPARGKVRGITYIADFVYFDEDGRLHVEDAKGFKTPVYILKKKMLFLLHGVEIEEV
jgi:hypothetical protein